MELITIDQKERRDLLKYLGTIAGGAAALAPQIIDRALQSEIFYTGIGLLGLAVITSIAYVLSSVENESSGLFDSLRDNNEMLEKLRAPKRDFLANGDYSVEAFAKAMGAGVEQLPDLRKRLENSKYKGNTWYKPKDYVGEFTVWFLVCGLLLLVMSITRFNLPLKDLICIAIGIFITINIVSTFPTKVFQILGLPVDLIKSLVRYIFKKN